jgi:GTP diphosphokinase / guanosine-3',5'-bis(diphosphate) 3'-diphosphatase
VKISRCLLKHLIQEQAMYLTPEDFEDIYSTARMAHMGQKRRSGEPYFTHPSEVRNVVQRHYPQDRLAQMAALLHDTIEDAPGSTVESADEMETFIRGSIADPRVAKKVINAVRSVTHDKGVDYSDYVVSLLGNRTALRVKLADMLHNLGTSPSDKQRRKYGNALKTLQDAAGGVPMGISQKHWQKLTDATNMQESAEKQLRLFVEEFIKGSSLT